MPRCQACGTEHAETEIAALTELGIQSPGSPVQLCQGCVERRQAAAWAIDTQEAERLLEALAEHPVSPTSRYAYMQDEANQLRLMRLRPGWIERHAQEA